MVLERQSSLVRVTLCGIQNSILVLGLELMFFLREDSKSEVKKYQNWPGSRLNSAQNEHIAQIAGFEVVYGRYMAFS